MLTGFALDLRLARRKSGLTQLEVAHLLNLAQSSLSDLERGETPPTIRQFTQLCLVYGRSFPVYFEELAEDIKPELRQRMKSLPERSNDSVTRFSRDKTLKKLNALVAEKDHGRV